MPSQYTMPNGQEVTPAQFASLGRVITAALGLDLGGLSDYRVIWLMKRVERTAVGKFDITSSGDAYLMKSAISEHLAEAAKQVDYPVTPSTTWDEFNLTHEDEPDSYYLRCSRCGALSDLMGIDKTVPYLSLDWSSSAGIEVCSNCEPEPS